MELLDSVAILSVGTLIGAEFAVSAFVNPILGRLSQGAEAEATRLFAILLGRVMPFWYAFCFLGLLAESALRFRKDGFALLALSSAIWMAVILLSVFVLVPINNRIAKMRSDDFDVELRRQQKRWNRLHMGRVFLLVVAIVCLLHAILVRIC